MRRHRRSRKRETCLWHRALAVLVAVAALLTGFDTSMLGSVFAAEKSGYTIKVTYSEDKSQAVLTGSTDSLGAGISLGELKDEDGNAFDPSEFETTVTENGTYTYTLTYQEAAEQTGNLIDKKEKIAVEVDQIVDLSSANIQVMSADAGQSAVQEETPAASNETQQPETDGTEELTDVPETVPLNVLKTSLAQVQADTRAGETINIYQYADENTSFEINDGQPVAFEGGEINADTAPAYDTNSGARPQRSFTYAGYVYTAEGSGDIPIEITGLYPYNNNWYYTTEDSASSENDGISAGYLLPEDAQVRFYYEIENGQLHNIILNADEVWNLTTDKTSGTANFGERVYLSLELPDTYAYGYVTVTSESAGYSHTFAIARYRDETQQPETGTYDEIQQGDSQQDTQYDLNFVMPNGDVTITVTGTAWNRNATRLYGVLVNESSRPATMPGEYGITRIFTTRVGNVTTDKITYAAKESNSDTGLGEHGEITMGTWENASGTRESQWNTAGGAAYHSQENYFRSSGGGSQLSRGGDYREIKLKANYTDLSLISNFVNTIIGPVANTNDVVSFDNTESRYEGQIANGRFVPGDDVELMIETTRGTWSTSDYGANASTEHIGIIYQYLPDSIWVDVYQASAFNNTDRYVRAVYDLPLTGEVGDAVTYEHPMGGTVTIEIVALNDYDYMEGSYAQSPQNLSEAYYRGWKTPVYAYKVTVSGMNQGFKVIYNSFTTSQRHYKIGELDGIKLPSTVQTATSAAAIDGSHIQFRQNNNGSVGDTYYASLAEGITWFGNFGSANNYTDIGIVPEDGYSLPEATITNQKEGMTVELQNNGQPDGNGKFIYRFTYGTNGGSNSNANNLPAEVNFTAKPVNFAVKYYGFNGDTLHQDNGSSLSYAGQRNYSVRYAVPEIPAGMYFGGYDLYIRTGDQSSTNLIRLGKDSTGNIIQVTDGSSYTKFQQGDVVTVQDVWEALRDSGQLQAETENYILAFVPTQTSEAQEQVDVTYSISKQQRWLTETETGNSATANDATYTGGGFTKTTGTLIGYLGTSMIIRGYQETINDSTGQYILDTYNSTFGADQVTANDQLVGDLYYLRAVSASIYLPADVKEAAEIGDTVEQAVQAWNNENASKLYTGVAGRTDRIVSLDGTDETTAVSLPTEITTSEGEKQLTGWKIVNMADTGELSSQATSELTFYNYTISNASGLGRPDNIDLYSLGTRSTAGAAVWDGIFGTEADNGTGQLVLVPYYETTYGPISSIQNNTNIVTTHTGGDPDENGENSGFDVTATFSYDPNEGTWDSHMNALTIALYRDTADGVGTAQDQLWGTFTCSNGQWSLHQTNHSSGKLKAGVEVTEGGDNTFTVKIRVLNSQQAAGDSIQYAWEDKDSANQTRYNVYAWTPANAPDSTIVAGDGTPPSTSVVAMHTTQVDVLPKAITSCRKTEDVVDGNLNGDEITTGIFHQRKWITSVDENEQGDVVITAQFDGDPYYPEELQIDGADTDAPDESRIRTALYRKDNSASDDNWIMVDNNGTPSSVAQGIVSGPDITITPTTQDGITYSHIEVTYTIEAGHFSDHEADLDFCITAWNNTNVTDEYGNAVDAEDFNPGNDVTEGSSSPYRYIPSVTSHVIVGWSDPGIYITVPQLVTLSEDYANVQDAEYGDYAGNKVDIYITDVNELPDGTTEGTPMINKIRVHIPREIPLMYSPLRKELTAMGYYGGETTDLTYGTLLPTADDGHREVGTFDISSPDEQNWTTALSFYLNASLVGEDLVRGEQYYGSMTFMFTNITDDENPGEETGTDENP